MRLAVIGPGHMAGAVVKGLLQVGLAKPESIKGFHPDAARAEQLSKQHGFSVLSNLGKAVAGADVVLLGVKPQIVPESLTALAPVMPPGAWLLSIAAGIATETMERALPGVPIIRAMPNLACTVQEGATALCAGTHADRKHLDQARAMFDAVGTVEEVPEKLMDAVTGLSGTGPMYVFHLVEGLADAGVKVGLSRAVASRLALQTLIGSARLAAASHLHPAALKDEVTSPGGTAIAALHVLRREGFQAVLMDAVEAATKRAAELGKAQ